MYSAPMATMTLGSAGDPTLGEIPQGLALTVVDAALTEPFVDGSAARPVKSARRVNARSPAAESGAEQVSLFVVKGRISASVRVA